MTHVRDVVRSVRSTIVLLTLLGTTALSAQSVSGTVVDERGAVLAGAIVSLLDDRGVEQGSVLSSVRGAYELKASTSGRFRLRARMLGYLPVVSETFSLTGTSRETRTLVFATRVSLATIRIDASSTCAVRRDGGADDAFTLWEQAMTSMLSARVLARTSGLTAATLSYSRRLDRTGRQVMSQSTVAQTSTVTSLWKSLAEDSLRTGGYVKSATDGSMTFNAPGLDVLTSANFLRDHCLRATRSSDSLLVGITFEPTAARAALAEIAGTLWIDRSSSQLRRMEFAFQNVPGLRDATPNTAGGSMEFATMRDGASVISSWEIRMPQLETDDRRTAVRIVEVLASGGQLVVARRGADTLFARDPLNVAGVVRDSVSRRAQPSARVEVLGSGRSVVAGTDGAFTIPDLLPGVYTLQVSTPSLDSIRAFARFRTVVSAGMEPLSLRVPTASQLLSQQCGRSNAGARVFEPAVYGTVTTGETGAALSGVRVAIEWSESTLRGGTAASVSQQPRRLETRTDSSGAFRVCGVPTQTALSVGALPDSGRSEARSVRLEVGQPYAVAALTVDYIAAAYRLRGRVFAATSKLPVVDAEILLPQLSVNARSNERGAFLMPSVPRGTHQLLVRRVGHRSVDTLVTIDAQRDQELTFYLLPATVLDSVRVTGSRTDVALLEFEENRRLGLGRFLTRASLAQQENTRFSEVVAGLSGVGMRRGGSHGYVMSKRFVVPISAQRICRGPSDASGGNLYVPSSAERSRGIACACYAQVYVDGHLMNSGQPTPPFDVNTLLTSQLEAVEWYAGPSEVPARYSRLNAACGVLVVHTRRPDGE